MIKAKLAIKQFVAGLTAFLLATSSVVATIPSIAIAAGGPACDAAGTPISRPETFDPTKGLGNLGVQFLSYSSGCGDEIVSYTWNFGDGISSTDKEPFHSFSIGTWQVALTVVDQAGLSDSENIEVIVKESNVAPTVNGEVDVTVYSGQTAIIDTRSAAGDVDGDILQWGSLQAVAGTNAAYVTSYADGRYGYKAQTTITQPTTEVFTYSVKDGFGGEAVGRVNVHLVNRAPIAQDDTVSIQEDATQTVFIKSWQNDSDVDGPNLAYSIVGRPSNGQVALVDPYGVFGYSPAKNFNGVDSFTYALSDGISTSYATVTINVSAVNDAPTVVTDNVSVEEDSSVMFSPLANDSDVDGDALTILSIDPSARGARVTLNNDGSVTYEPADNYTYGETLWYTVSDGKTTSRAPIYITINPLNDVPIAEFSASVSKPRNLSVSATASDVDRDNLTYTWSFGDGSANLVSTSTTASHTYSRKGSYVVTLTVSDGKGGQIVLTKTVTV